MRPRRATLLFLIDAMGWEVLKRHPILVAECGSRFELRGILGFSTAAIPSMLTGKYPAETGRWGLFQLGGNGSPFRWTRYLSFLPDGLLETRLSRKLINVVSRFRSGYTGYFSSFGLPVKSLRYFDLSERENIYRVGGIPGHETIIDRLHAGDETAVAFSYHDGTDEDIFRMVAERLAGAAPPARVFAYLAGLDALLHAHVGDLEAERAKMEWYERSIRDVVAAARRRFDAVDIHVFSDHGMARVAGTIDVKGALDATGLRERRDYLVVLDSTMARIWPRSPEAGRRIVAALEALEGGRLLGEEELRRLGVWFDPPVYGEVIYLLEPGRIIFPSFFSFNVPRGMHGYHPDDPDSSAAYLSNVSPAEPPRAIVDVPRAVFPRAAEDA